MEKAMNDYEKEHLDLVRKSAAECTLFLRRGNGFPLSAPGDIALYGSGVRHTVKGGTGSGEVNSRSFTTVEDGFRNAGFHITTGLWLDRYDEIREAAFRDFVRQIRQAARKKHTLAITEGMGAVMPEPEYALPIVKQCDTAVYVLSRISGEGNDRRMIPGDVLLSHTEQRDILKLQQLYPRFLLVLNVGGPVDLSGIADRVDNILLLSQLGAQTGDILADIVLGRACPSGKLTTTWAAAGDCCTLGDFGHPDETRYREGIYVGYRYFDTVGKKPLFPFGFGLGYTDFAISEEKALVNGQQVTVTANVTNIGNYPGREVVQAYVSCPMGVLDQPYQALAAFAKSPELMPGQSAQVTLQFIMGDLASFDEKRSAWVLEAGDYILRLGSSSTSTRETAVLRLPEEVVTLQVRSLHGEPDFNDRKPQSRVLHSDAPVFLLDPSEIPTGKVDYDLDEPIDPEVQALSDEELVYRNIGAFASGGGVTSVIGEASSAVAGAAGETCGRMKEQGFPVLVMADGPAGLRLARKYYTDEKGAHGLEQSMPETMLAFLPGFLKPIMNRPPKEKPGTQIREQYATTIPIGTAIAQSFSLEFARSCGDLVGSEMQRFGVHLWLAPALNIHRNILCGRNFEYFSEDPLVSGLMAAAITQGVQQHPGCGTTIKHFAANNQETNRYNSNSLVSQRALREIYLRGFEICIRHSQPLALMTSYNLINGVHTSESRELTQDILRGEFGYRGIVMTDWVVGGKFIYNSMKYPMPDAGRVAMAGGDLFMPGSKGDYSRCKKMLEQGTLTRRQLEINATRVLRLAKMLTQQQKD